MARGEGVMTVGSRGRTPRARKPVLGPLTDFARVEVSSMIAKPCRAVFFSTVPSVDSHLFSPSLSC